MHSRKRFAARRIGHEFVMSAIILVAMGSFGCGVHDVASFNEALAEAICQHEIDCGFADPSSKDICLAGYGSFAEPPDWHNQYDPSAGSACLQAIANAPCIVGANIAACQLAVTGAVAAGGACRLDDCAPGTTCEVPPGADKCSYGVCVAAPTSPAPSTGAPAGAPCALDEFQRSRSACADGLVCDTTLSRPACAPEKQLGESCGAYDACASKLLCINQRNESYGICTPPIPLGNACQGRDEWTSGCQKPYLCENGICVDHCNTQCSIGFCDPSTGTCRPQVPVGASCDPTISFQCEPRAVCAAATCVGPCR